MFMLWQCDEPCTPAKWRERADFAYVINEAACPRSISRLDAREGPSLRWNW